MNNLYNLIYEVQTELESYMIHHEKYFFYKNDLQNYTIGNRNFITFSSSTLTIFLKRYKVIEEAWVIAFSTIWWFLMIKIHTDCILFFQPITILQLWLKKIKNIEITTKDMMNIELKIIKYLWNKRSLPIEFDNNNFISKKLRIILEKGSKVDIKIIPKTPKNYILELGK